MPWTPLCPQSPSQAKLTPHKHANNFMNLWVTVITTNNMHIYWGCGKTMPFLHIYLTDDGGPSEQRQSHQVLYSPDFRGSGTLAWRKRKRQWQSGPPQRAQEGANQSKLVVVLYFNTGGHQTPLFKQAGQVGLDLIEDSDISCNISALKSQIFKKRYF